LKSMEFLCILWFTGLFLPGVLGLFLPGVPGLFPHFMEIHNLYIHLYIHLYVHLYIHPYIHLYAPRYTPLHTPIYTPILYIHQYIHLHINRMLVFRMDFIEFHWISWKSSGWTPSPADRGQWAHGWHTTITWTQLQTKFGGPLDRTHGSRETSLCNVSWQNCAEKVTKWK
jgi:hypothetical protein